VLRIATTGMRWVITRDHQQTAGPRKPELGTL
jgi:hypothetical protein